MGVCVRVYRRGDIYKSGGIFTNWLYNHLFFIINVVRKTKLNY